MTGRLAAALAAGALFVVQLTPSMTPMQEQPSLPQATPFVIVAMGDSTTAGTPLFKSSIEDPPDGSGDPTSAYAYWLVHAHPEWRLRNRGVNGERSDEIAARFERDAITDRPHVVVLIAGVNDVYQGRPVEHVTTELRGMYDRAREAGIPVVAGSIVPFNTATAEQNAKMHEINEWIKAQAKRDPNLSFVDTRKAVAAKDNPDKLASSGDNLHPDIAGYRKMAEAIEVVLVRVLKAGSAA